MVDKNVLGFLWIDIHSTRNDHVRLAVSEVQELVVVEVADIAKC